MSTSSPYHILGVNGHSTPYEIRVKYRELIQEYTKYRLYGSGDRKITTEDFRLMCRAYETLSFSTARKKYDETREWTTNLPLKDYTLQQLAAEPELINELKDRVKSATLRMINAQDSHTGQTPLYSAARACNIEAVDCLMQQGADPDIPQNGRSTALHVAAFYGHPEMIRCLLENGADYRKRDPLGYESEAVSENDAVKEVFKELKYTPFVQTAADQLDWLKNNLKSIKHIDEQYFVQRQTLLHCASRKGYTNIVRWLVEEQSADLDIVDVNLNSPLHLAAYGNHGEVVQYLLNRGANPLQLNKWCVTAEQEGSWHGTTITNIFQSMRERNMLEMAGKGNLWWFQYYFGDQSPNSVNQYGFSPLYIACRNGRDSVAEWLLNKGADVNMKRLKPSQSTPLHVAAYHGNISTVELLLNHGADVNVKNSFNTTPVDEARTEEIRKLLRRHRIVLDQNKYFSVHLYGDGKTSGDTPLAKLELTCDASCVDIFDAVPGDLKNQFTNFTVGQRPLNFDKDKITVLSAVCRARFVNSKFIQLPVCLTAHGRPHYRVTGYSTHEEPSNHDMRDVHQSFMSKCESYQMKIRGQFSNQQTFSMGDLTFIFPNNCANEDTIIEVDYIMSPDYDLFNLPECVCFFTTKFKTPTSQLNDMPIVSFNGEPNARLYNWVQPTAYWFMYRIQHDRLIAIGETHAFVRHVEIFPSLLSLPPDMFIAGGVGQPLRIRDTPVHCKWLKIREHNKDEFPHIAYHGTNIKAIESILLDGLVMPSTVVSGGMRICPPSNHIARGVEAFGLKDFSNGIFMTPSIHFCSDPAYAVRFKSGDECLIPVLECTVKKGSFTCHPPTVLGYKLHEDDNPAELEWRLTNPACIEIISVLFIPIVKSAREKARLRIEKLSN